MLELCVEVVAARLNVSAERYDAFYCAYVEVVAVRVNILAKSHDAFNRHPPQPGIHLVQLLPAPSPWAESHLG